MTDSAIAEKDIVTIGNQSLIAIGDGERNKVEGLADEAAATGCGLRPPCAATRLRKG